MNRNEELITCIIHHLHAQAVTGGQKNSSIGVYYYNQLYQLSLKTQISSLVKAEVIPETQY